MLLEDYYDKFSTRSLESMHDAADRAYKHDRALTPQEKQSALCFRSPFTYYGTDEEKDWPEHVDALEKVMTKKGITFTPIQK
ncbi:hypothetical protein FGL54_00355 [Enterobacter cloacae]|nr:hypothetical protein FGL54_00355 [Enterobacter cloacae]HEI9732984.1 hypothetical protein [Enterobacter cloacae]HEW9969158.1 hypothetical protein [Enterobacter cloacae]